MFFPCLEALHPIQTFDPFFPASNLFAESYDKESGSLTHVLRSLQLNLPQKIFVAQHKTTSNVNTSPGNVQTYLKAHGLRVDEASKDGNCLFHSIAVLLNRRGEGEIIRQEVVDYMSYNRSNFESFVASEGKRYDDYLNRMRISGEWGSYIEIVAASAKYCTPFTVISENLFPEGYRISAAEFQQTCPVSQDEKVLVFEEYGHYNATQPTTRNLAPVQNLNQNNKRLQNKGDGFEQRLTKKQKVANRSKDSEGIKRKDTGVEVLETFLSLKEKGYSEKAILEKLNRGGMRDEDLNTLVYNFVFFAHHPTPKKSAYVGSLDDLQKISDELDQPFNVQLTTSLKEGLANGILQYHTYNSSDQSAFTKIRPQRKNTDLNLVQFSPALRKETKPRFVWITQEPALFRQFRRPEKGRVWAYFLGLKIIKR